MGENEDEGVSRSRADIPAEKRYAKKADPAVLICSFFYFFLPSLSSWPGRSCILY